MIHLLAFHPQRRKRPLASKKMELFEVTPLPLIAYVCTAVSFDPQFACHSLIFFKQLGYGLEEYSTGKLIRSAFSESDNRAYYRELLRSLREMDSCEEAGPLLDEIRKYIFKTGVYVLSLEPC